MIAKQASYPKAEGFLFSVTPPLKCSQTLPKPLTRFVQPLNFLRKKLQRDRTNPEPINRSEGSLAVPDQLRRSPHPNPKTVNQAVSRPRASSSFEYTPYTLQEYRAIRQSKYYELGKLGSNQVGSEEWKAKQQALLLKKHYAHQANLSNLKRLKNQPKVQPIAVSEASAWKRALLYSKGIKKPPLHFRPN